jgi:hypothetical protein
MQPSQSNSSGLSLFAVTIGILGTLWTLGGIRLLWSGSSLLMSQVASVSGPILILCLVLALSLGLAKGKLVLQKTAQRSIESAKLLNNEPINFALGWLKVLGVRGLIVIAIMIGFGIFFASSISPLSPFLRGLVRITIAAALLTGSLRFWSELKTVLSKG